MNVNAIADELAHEPEQELLIKRTPKKSGACGQATNGAFGAPGAFTRIRGHAGKRSLFLFR
jgi:hypothetical protein